MSGYSIRVFWESLRVEYADSPYFFSFDLMGIIVAIFYGYLYFDDKLRKFFMIVSIIATVLMGVFTDPNTTFRMLKYAVFMFGLVCFVTERVIFQIRYGYLNRAKKDNGTSILALDEFKDEVCVPEGENIAGINMTFTEIEKAKKAIVKLNRKDGYESEIRSANKIIDSFYAYSAKTKNDFVQKETYDNIKNMRKQLEKLVLEAKNKKH